MKTLPFILLGFTLGASSLQARLGETEVQIKARYGECRQFVTLDSKVYESDGLRIIVSYEYGKSVSESFSFLDKQKTFDKILFDRLFSVNSFCSKWIITGKDGSDTHFKLESGYAEADLQGDMKGIVFYISTNRDKPNYENF